MKAIKTVRLGCAEVVDEVPVPSIKGFPGYALVKTSHVGIQMCDNQFTFLPFCFFEGITIGVDYCGTVVDIDPAVTHVKKGDRVSGAIFPTNKTMPNAGTFAEYVLAKADGMFRVDTMGDMSEAQAATLGVGIWTVFMSLYYMIGLPQPGTPEAARGGNGTIVIAGGSTWTGMWLTQFATLSGVKVIATASPRNHELLRSLGADTVVDYCEEDRCIREILTAAGGPVSIVIDCVDQDTTSKICDGVLAPGGKYYSLTMSRSSREDVESVFIPGNQVNGESYIFGGQTHTPPPNITEKTRPFLRLVEKLFQEGKLRVPKVEVSSGWDAVLERMKDVREHKASGFKYVVSVGP